MRERTPWEVTVPDRTKPPALTKAITPSLVDIKVQRFAATSRLLHWLIAVVVLATWPLGFVIQFVKGEVSLNFYLLHESFGFLVLWLMLVRVGNRLIARHPRAEGSALERRAAACVHTLLYVFLIAMPVSGFLATNAHGFPLVWFGILPIWSPIAKAPALAGAFSAIHFWSAWILLALFALHIGAVLLHHIIKRDHTLYRML
ncbi:cytochrome b [Allorhizobium terrae]|uniref:Cytochrome b n=1 Tax=Allorhizobium terrae TaxID=1848972 RepID=A0A4S3ZUY7_9HYPH|nr:cytochrome b [Allorhizobium terrae]